MLTSYRSLKETLCFFRTVEIIDTRQGGVGTLLFECGGGGGLNFGRWPPLRLTAP